ncbi:prevent-host-death family protein [Bacteriovorax sp. BAL6_X]|uniref:type II toxin-antitoxin system Phd/YefM family antitoxin n=1 Tax=Bacteriovorax sp. BAL6_X TaxID=1201290 RepID=UPI0003862AA4|nr:type II toxin-antitoxin system Phd/YefM family antitoxin [Bacteriovorax sp. BAL6_X]EPZ50944.1 prevent-host-death family protein [Bacteriovorax sp. BAL6_X]
MAIPKIKSASELRNDLYNSLKEASDGDMQVVTHKQGEPVVLISQSELNRVIEENETLKKLSIGLSDVRNNRSYSTDQVRETLANRRKERDNDSMV